MFDVPKFRIRTRYISYVGDDAKWKELSLRLLVIGDCTLKEPASDDVLADRQRIRIDRDNFGEVMKSQNLCLEFTVPNRMGIEEGEPISINLKFDNLDSFLPEAIIKQVEPLKRILEDRDSGAVSLDRSIGAQIDEILHHEKFQELESVWRGLYFLVSRTDFQSNITIEILDVSREDLARDFKKAADPLKSGLFQHVYVQAYDQYAADPFSLMVANYEFDNSERDINLLRCISDVAAVAHCPFIAAVSPSFFGLNSFEEFAQIPDLKEIMNSPEYKDWNSFRESLNSRYIGLTLPKFLLRIPYSEDTVKVEGFNYMEDVKRTDHDKYIWGNSSLALASNIVRSFADHNWPVNIVGAESGGFVEHLPPHVYNVGDDVQEYRIPLEMSVPDIAERNLAEEGFIPLCVLQDERVGACFFSAYSAHKPKVYDDEVATATSQLSARLSYMLFITRLMHYLRAIQRDELGRISNPNDVQEKLNKWIQQYVCGPDPRSERLKAERPLQHAHIVVQESEHRQGFFQVQLFAKPHFQAGEFEIDLSLADEMPMAR